MKKISSLIIAIAVCTSAINAKPIASNIAQTVAKNFFSLTTGHTVNSITLAYTESDSSGTPVYYVFNINPDQSTEKGFVIISADDATHPVIGYGNENRTYVTPKNEGNAANAFYWMQKRKNEIIRVRRGTIYHAPTDTAIAGEWKSYLNNTLPQNARQTHGATSTTFPSSTAFLVQTTWDQINPDGPPGTLPIYYNSLCPDHSYTGCEATAMAQIMKYWQYPSKGTSSSSYCDCSADGYLENYGTLSANYGSATYHWSNMPLDPTKATDIDTLMYDVGVSMEMDYSPTESLAVALIAEDPYASVQNSLVEYFGYSNAILDGIYIRSETTWQDTLEHELDRNRPLIYEGNNATGGGHAWVCDGYDATNYFHMNWGWNGNFDGWFALTDLAPGNGDDFTTDIDALVGITPPSSDIGAGIEEYNNSESINLYPNPTTGQFALSGLQQGMILEMYDYTGKMISTVTTTNESMQLNILNQANGVYLIRILDKDGNLIGEKKVVKTQ